MISTPKMDEILDGVQPGLMNRFADAKDALEVGLAAKHIWNTEYQSAKDTISRVWERVDNVAHQYLTEMYYRGHDLYRSWQESDPRFNMGLCQLLNTPGYAKRMKAVKNAPELAEYIAVLDEVAQLAELVKALKPYIEKGRKPNPNAVPVDMSGMATCGICGGEFKLDGQHQLVHHGFRISDGRGYIGSRVGSCFGVGYQPYELSNKANIDYQEYLRKVLAGYEKDKQDLQDNKFSTLSEMVRVRVGNRYEDEKRTYDRGTREYDKLCQTSLHRVESDIRHTESEIEYQGEYIAKWQPKPLPYGERLAKHND